MKSEKSAKTQSSVVRAPQNQMDLPQPVSLSKALTMSANFDKQAQQMSMDHRQHPREPSDTHMFASQNMMPLDGLSLLNKRHAEHSTVMNSHSWSDTNSLQNLGHLSSHKSAPKHQTFDDRVGSIPNNIQVPAELPSND